MKLVEERSGQCRLTVRGQSFGQVPYSINRFQAMTAGGLPVPGLHRIEGRVALDVLPDAAGIEAEMAVSMELEDGRRIDLTLVDLEGRVLAIGHGPGKCGCC
jgi:hypothetical protein